MPINMFSNALKVLQKKHEKLEKINLVDNDSKILYSTIVENECKFRITVVGEFLRGKSTFINALLGNKILPCGKLPTTNIITRIVYSDNPFYKIVKKDGKNEYLTKEEFKDIGEIGSDKILTFGFKTVDEIDYAVIGMPLDLCKNSVEFIDTPGTNDLNIRHMRYKYDYLNYANIIILMLNATLVLTRSELDFLKERILSNQIKNVLVVINFKDQLIHAEEVKVKVKNYVKGKIRELAEIEPKIFLVSSFQALIYKMYKNGMKLNARERLYLPHSFEETGFVELERELFNYINKSVTKNKIINK